MGADRRRQTGKTPVIEHIVTDVSESFLWRLDDYPWERNVWNIHPEYEIHLVRKGSGVALVGDSIEPFGPGHLCIVGSYLPHDWVTTTAPGEIIAGRDIVLQFDADRIRNAASALPEFSEVSAFLDAARRGLSFAGETRREGAKILEAMGAVRGLERLSLFFHLLACLSAGDYRFLSSTEFSPGQDRTDQGWMQPVLSYLVENSAQELRLSVISARFGMTEWTFSRRFQKASGKSFTDYLTTLRLSQACKLLADSEMPVTDICFEVGYTNVSNFNRAFLRARGMPPSRYRRLARQRVTQRSPAASPDNDNLVL